MQNITKYILFTFTSALIIQAIISNDVNSGSIAQMMEASYLSSLNMLTPTIGALIARARFSEMGWNPRFSSNSKLLLFALLMPTVFTLVGAGLYFLVFPDDFDTSGKLLSESELDALAEFKADGRSYADFVTGEIVSSVFSFYLIIAIFWGLCEEIGWRGFLYPELKKYTRRTKALILGGVIHGAWHFPLMVLMGYEYGTDYIGAPFLGLVAFCIFTVSTGIISDYLYVKSKSIWFPAIFHGAVNSSFNPRFLRGDEHPERTIFGPAEIGLISGIPIVIAAAVILYIENKNEKLQYEEI